jgi:hypothetical protein
VAEEIADLSLSRWLAVGVCCLCFTSAAYTEEPPAATAAEVAAATAISSTWRGHNLRARYNKLRILAIHTQRLVRGSQARLEFRRRRDAVLLLQRAIPRVHRRRVARAHEAARLLQRSFRRALVRRQLAKLAAAVTVVSKHRRGALALRAYTRTRAAIIRVQAIARGGRVRLVVRRVRREAAVRRWQARAAYLTVRHATITAQASIRRHRARKSYRIVQRLAILLARVWRSVKVWRQVKLHLERVAAATAISCAWRRWRAMAAYSCLRAAVATAQKNARAARAMRRFRRCLRSVIIVQSVIRGWSARRLVGNKEQGSLEDVEQPAEGNVPHMKRDSDGSLVLDNDQGRDLDDAAGSGPDSMDMSEQGNGKEDPSLAFNGCGAGAGLIEAGEQRGGQKGEEGGSGSPNRWLLRRRERGQSRGSIGCGGRRRARPPCGMRSWGESCPSSPPPPPPAPPPPPPPPSPSPPPVIGSQRYAAARRPLRVERAWRFCWWFCGRSARLGAPGVSWTLPGRPRIPACYSVGIGNSSRVARL